MLHRYGHDRTIGWGVLNHGSIWCAFSAERPFILRVIKCPCNTLWDPAVHVICCLGKNSSATSAGKARQKRLHMSDKTHLTGRHNRKLMKEFFRQEQATQWRNWLYSTSCTSCVRRNEMSWAHSEIAQPRSYFTHRDDQSKTPSWWKADHWVIACHTKIYEICCQRKEGSNALISCHKGFSIFFEKRKMPKSRCAKGHSKDEHNGTHGRVQWREENESWHLRSWASIASFKEPSAESKSW